MLILGLDMSSTCIGYALIDGARVKRFGHHDLTGDIGARCCQAALHIAKLLEAHEPALVVIESPVARFAKAVIPQARVSGAVLAVLADASALWVEKRPQDGKAALCGDGAATKREMVEEAGRLLGLVAGPPCHYRGKWGLWDGSKAPILTEDEADAIGLALAGRAVRVEVAA